MLHQKGLTRYPRRIKVKQFIDKLSLDQKLSRMNETRNLERKLSDVKHRKNTTLSKLVIGQTGTQERCNFSLQTARMSTLSDEQGSIPSTSRVYKPHVSQNFKTRLRQLKKENDVIVKTLTEARPTFNRQDWQRHVAFTNKISKMLSRGGESKKRRRIRTKQNVRGLLESSNQANVFNQSY